MPGASRRYRPWLAGPPRASVAEGERRPRGIRALTFALPVVLLLSPGRTWSAGVRPDDGSSLKPPVKIVQKIGQGYRSLAGRSRLFPASKDEPAPDLTRPGRSLQAIGQSHSPALGRTRLWGARKQDCVAPAFVSLVGSRTETAVGTTIVVTVGAGGAASGNRVVVVASFQAPGIIEPPISASCADSKGNTYNADGALLSFDPYPDTYIFSAHVTTPLVAGDTITVTHSPTAIRGATAQEWSGIKSGSDVTQYMRDTHQDINGGGTSVSSGNATFGESDFAFAVVATWSANSAFTPEGGWTDRAGFSVNSGGSFLEVYTEEKIKTGSGEDGLDGTLSVAANANAWTGMYLSSCAGGSSGLIPPPDLREPRRGPVTYSYPGFNHPGMGPYGSRFIAWWARCPSLPTPKATCGTMPTPGETCGVLPTPGETCGTLPAPKTCC